MSLSKSGASSLPVPARFPGKSRRKRSARRRSSRLTRSHLPRFESLEDRRLLAHLVGTSPAIAPAHPVWAPDTPLSVIEAWEAKMGHELDDHLGHLASGSVGGVTSMDGAGHPSETTGSSYEFSAFRFGDFDRWSRTASSGDNLTQGTPTTLTWSLVPDGTSIAGFNGEPTSDSNLIGFLDGLYGAGPGGNDLTQRPWFATLSSAFDRWSELSGVEYVYEPADDGAAWTPYSLPNGELGVRGDVRLSGHPIDGRNGMLGYNFYPNAGDMVIDTSDSFFSNLDNDSLRLRNLVAHELGHGLGLGHVGPINRTKLMEAYMTTAFDGPQFDDILASHRGYGDAYEQDGGNDHVGVATSLGTLGLGESLSLGGDALDSRVLPGDVDFVSIDDDSDIDFFEFRVTESGRLSVNLAPVGPTYLSGSSNSGGETFDASAQNDLTLELLASDGTTSLGFANAHGLGEAESLASITLNTAGSYFVKVGGLSNAAQFYQLELTISGFGNHLPTAHDDSFTVTQDSSPIMLDVLRNDSFAPDTNETLTIVSTTAASAGGSVRINQAGTAIEYAPQAGYVGTETFTYTINDGTPGSNDTATVTINVYDPRNVNFNDYTLGGYAGSNDKTGPVTIEDGGLTLRMEGNRWKQINLPYQVTENTVIELDFRSTHQGEIHAIGMNADTSLNIPRNIQLFGTQTSGVQNHRDYDAAPGFKHYVIPIGQYYTGQMNHLFFVNDHDVSNPTAVSYFSNVRLYEAGQNNPPTANDDSFSIAADSGSNLLNVLANDTTEPDSGETLNIISATPGSAGGTVQVSQDGSAITYSPLAGFTGSETFTYTINDGTDGSNDTATVTVSVTDQTFLNFNDYSIGRYATSNDKTGPVTLEDGGLTLRMEGNRWKQIQFAYQVTANTVIELDFRSPAQGEIHAIGMDDDTGLSIPRNIQLFGTQTSGVQDQRNYDQAPEFKHYVIPIGQYYRGQMNHLFFVNDHDVSNPTAVSYFSNIQIYERPEASLLATTLESANASPRQALASPDVGPSPTQPWRQQPGPVGPRQSNQPIRTSSPPVAVSTTGSQPWEELLELLARDQRDGV